MKRQAAGKAWSYMSRRVVVTGMGAITPVGLGTAEFWNSVKEGKHGFAPITRFDVSEYKCKIAAEVKGFDAREYMDFKAAKRMEAFSQYAVAAAAEALADSGLSMERKTPISWAAPSAPASEAYRQWSGSIQSFLKRGRTGLIR